MGHVRLPRIHEYWSTSPIFTLPWFSSIMSRDRFFKISEYLHLADALKQKKNGESGYYPPYKVRPLINATSPYIRSGNDDMMVGTHCRMHFFTIHS